MLTAINGKMRNSMKIPAETMAAAWMMALTGVGPSIASGNQTCSGHWADLPTVPVNSSSVMMPSPPKPTRLITCSNFSTVNASLKSSVPNAHQKKTMPSSMTTSAMRVVMNAFLAASRGGMRLISWCSG